VERVLWLSRRCGQGYFAVVDLSRQLEWTGATRYSSWFSIGRWPNGIAPNSWSGSHRTELWIRRGTIVQCLPRYIVFLAMGRGAGQQGVPRLRGQIQKPVTCFGSEFFSNIVGFMHDTISTTRRIATERHYLHICIPSYWIAISPVEIKLLITFIAVLPT
jgi:hypothetical protein